MKINNYLLNEILHINDISLIDVVLYLFNDFAKIPEKQLFTANFFLKSVGKVTSNVGYITDKMKSKGVTDFVFVDKINNNEVVFEFKPKYIELFSSENVKRYFTDIDVSIIYNLHSLYSKKLYIYFEMNKYKINQRINYNELSVKELKNALNIVGYELNGHFIQIITRFFEDIKEMLPNYEFKISHKKDARKIISLLCFFNESPDIKTETSDYQTEIIELPKQPEVIKQVVNSTPKITPQSTKIEKSMIEMDDDEIDSMFGNIDNLFNNPSVEIIPESEKFVKPIIREEKKVVPEAKEEIKEEIKTENMTILEQITHQMFLAKKRIDYKLTFEYFKDEFFRDGTIKYTVTNSGIIAEIPALQMENIKIHLHNKKIIRCEDNDLRKEVVGGLLKTAYEGITGKEFKIIFKGVK